MKRVTAETVVTSTNPGNIGILSNVRYFNCILGDARVDCEIFMNEPMRIFADVDLIFFDPDTGPETPSKPLGRKDSCRYLYLRVIEMFAGRTNRSWSWG